MIKYLILFLVIIILIFIIFHQELIKIPSYQIETFNTDRCFIRNQGQMDVNMERCNIYYTNNTSLCDLYPELYKLSIYQLTKLKEINTDPVQYNRKSYTKDVINSIIIDKTSNKLSICNFRPDNLYEIKKKVSDINNYTYEFKRQFGCLLPLNDNDIVGDNISDNIISKYGSNINNSCISGTNKTPITNITCVGTNCPVSNKFHVITNFDNIQNNYNININNNQIFLKIYNNQINVAFVKYNNTTNTLVNINDSELSTITNIYDTFYEIKYKNPTVSIRYPKFNLTSAITNNNGIIVSVYSSSGVNSFNVFNDNDIGWDTTSTINTEYFSQYSGEFLKFDLGETIVLKSFDLYPNSVSKRDKSPKNFRIYATNSELDYRNLGSPLNIIENEIPNFPTKIGDTDNYYYSFTNTGNNNSITFLKDTICDILIIGGGSAGSIGGEGGSSGNILYYEKINMVANTYNIRVGIGGVNNGVNGTLSEILNNNMQKITLNNEVSSLSENKNNMIAWYKFDGNFLDSSDKGHTLINTISSFDNINKVDGTSSIRFPSNQRGKVEFPKSIHPYNIWNYSTSGITFSLWFRYDTQAGVWGRLIDFQSDKNRGSGILIAIKTSHGKGLYFQIGNTVFEYSDHGTTTGKPLDGYWHHILWSIDKSGNWTIYYDGINLNCNKIGPLTNIATYNVRYIANSAFGDSHGDASFSGNIDDLRIYNIVLTQSDVMFHYNRFNFKNIYVINGLRYNIYNISTSRPSFPGNGGQLSDSIVRKSGFVPNLNYDWGSGTILDYTHDNIMINFTGYIRIPGTGIQNIKFYSIVDDGLYMKINNQVILNSWIDQGPRYYNAESDNTQFNGGQLYPIDIWFYERGGGAVIKLYWKYNGIISIIPSEYFTISNYENKGIKGILTDITGTSLYYGGSGGSTINSCSSGYLNYQRGIYGYGGDSCKNSYTSGGNGIVIIRYIIPKSYENSNGNNWIRIYEHNPPTASPTNIIKYTINNTAPYRYYAIVVNKNWIDNNYGCSISKLKLFGYQQSLTETKVIIPPAIYASPKNFNSDVYLFTFDNNNKISEYDKNTINFSLTNFKKNGNYITNKLLNTDYNTPEYGRNCKKISEYINNNNSSSSELNLSQIDAKIIEYNDDNANLGNQIPKSLTYYKNDIYKDIDISGMTFENYESYNKLSNGKFYLSNDDNIYIKL